MRTAKFLRRYYKLKVIMYHMLTSCLTTAASALGLELYDVFPGGSSLGQSDIIRKLVQFWLGLQIAGLQMRRENIK